eukprot:gene13235-15283_t
MESGAEAMLLKKFEEKDCAVENFYFKSYPAVEFIVQAFEELERDRLFLRWSYPFVFLEFDDKPSTTSGRGGVSVTSGAGALQDNRQEFLNLQATFEYFTETLSYLISRNRLRATKEEIEKATRDARAKRIEMEEFIIQYYLTRRPEAAMERVPSTTSSLTSRSSLEDEAEEDDEEPEPVHLVPTQPIATADFDISDDEDDDPVPAPEPPPQLPPREPEKSNRAFTRIDHTVQTISQITTETERSETLFRAGSFLRVPRGGSATAAATAAADAAVRGPTAAAASATDDAAARWSLFDADFDECFVFDRATQQPAEATSDIVAFFVTDPAHDHYDDVNPLMNGLLAPASPFRAQYLQHYAP